MKVSSSVIVESDQFFSEFGAKIQAFRKAKKLTQAEVSQLCGVGTRFLSELENGKSTVEMGKVLQVIHALDLEFNLSDSPKRKQQQREKQQSEVLKRLSQHPDIKSGNTQQGIPLITEALAEVLATEHNGVWFFNQEKDLLIAQDEYNLSKNKHDLEDNYRKQDYPDFFDELLRSRVLVEQGDTNIQLDKHEFAEEIRRYGITSTLDSPITLDGEIIGLVSSEHCKVSHTWSSDEITFHSHVAGIITELLRNERYRQLTEDFELQKQRDKQQQSLIMQLVNQASFRQGYYAEALQHLMAAVADYFNVDTVSYWVKEQGDNNFSLYSHYAIKEQRYIAVDQVDVNSVLALRHASELITRHSGSGSENPKHVCQSIFKNSKDNTICSVLETGVYVAGDIVAVIALAKQDSAYCWHPYEESFITEISNQLSQLIINVKLKENERRANEKLIYASNLQRVVSDLSIDSRIVDASKFDEAVRYINEVVATALSLEGCGVWLIGDKSEILHNVDYYQRSENRHYIDDSYSREQYPCFFEAIEKEKTVAADDARNDKRTFEFLEKEQLVYGISSSMDSAIRLQGKTAGILNVEHYGEIRHWTVDEIAFHGAVADIIGFMLVNRDYRQRELEERQRLEQEAKRISRLQMQNTIITDIAVSKTLADGDVSEVIKAVCEKAVSVLQCQRSEIWWLAENDDDVINIAQGYDVERQYYDTDRSYCLKDSQGYYDLLTSGRQIVFDNSDRHAKDKKYFSEILEDKSVLAGIDVAIRVRGETVGLLSVEHCKTDRIWQEDEIAFVFSLSDQITQALMNKESIEEDAKIQQSRERLSKNQEVIVKLATHEDVINGNLQNVADLITRQAAIQLNIYNTGIWMFDYEAKRAWLLSSYVLEGDYYEEDLQQFSHGADFNDEFYTELRRRRTVAIEDTLNDPLAKSFSELFYIPENISSSLESAIRVQGKMVGAINLDHRGDTRQWTNEEIAMCGGLADVMAHAIMNNERKNSQQRYKELAEKREEMDAIINGSRFVVVEWGEGDNSPIDFVSDNICQFGYLPEDFYEDKNLYRKIINPEDYQYNLDIINSVEELRGDDEYTIEYRIITKTGEWRWIEERTKIYRDTQGEVSHYHGVLCDITERKESAHKLLMLSNAVEHSASGVFIVDNKMLVEYVNPTLTNMTGYAEQELLGTEIYKIKVTDRTLANLSLMFEAVEQQQSWHGELEICSKSGDKVWGLISMSPIRDDMGKLTHYVAVCEDITEHKNHQSQMEQLAYYDTLTGLENRRLFKDNLTHLLVSSIENNNSFALLFLDLDRFKMINDTLGHDAGDQLLVNVSERLLSCIGADDSVARLGGDEFTIILGNTQAKEEGSVAAVATRIIEQLSKPMVLSGEEVAVTVSIGITQYPGGGKDVSELMKNADIAMYKAKSLGRNTFQFYNPDLKPQA
ncbi:diguanylate cyclase [Dasania sp. GY-MA-18]|uniref:Diguanylate cyclase n=1 Tax=Dasania phycosphaerae TaxID=2950436 RepID=A0A9J6RHQ2_9GAMM|nr:MULTISPECIES: diguanylate cyclase [Dasania]MCR8921307.1 diguanylate cyclase [Dasania sp. GY-MA-18]MCZ0863735.1 diguanylate cyclase [Dasania phycosphaerae]MCZ0867463.1 diguanylate cyclase [Dasania phycosphaerae]